LAKHKTETKTQFIDATGEDFFSKETNNNVMTDAHIEAIMQLFETKDEVAHIATTINNAKIAC